MADATHNRSHRSASDCLCSVTIGPAACMGQLGINGRLGCHKFAQTLLSTRSRCLHLAKFATCFFRFALCALTLTSLTPKRNEPNRTLSPLLLLLLLLLLNCSRALPQSIIVGPKRASWARAKVQFACYDNYNTHRLALKWFNRPAGSRTGSGRPATLPGGGARANARELTSGTYASATLGVFCFVLFCSLLVFGACSTAAAAATTALLATAISGRRPASRSIHFRSAG